MSVWQDRRVLALGGTALALTAGLVVAVVLVRSEKAPSAPPPASQGGLIVQTGRDDDLKLDPVRPLRCFVGGQFVGELPLSVCAKRNGVATGALDVGLDQSGALAASGGTPGTLTPLAPSPVGAAASPALVSAPTGPGEPSSACWRYANGGWTPLTGDFSVNACAQTLFSGQCVRAGGAIYGRWGERTLRLVPGRIEISSDNRNFRTLVEQTTACPSPGLG